MRRMHTKDMPSRTCDMQRRSERESQVNKKKTEIRKNYGKQWETQKKL